jgi:predicted nucleic acid-binding protein
MAQADPTRQIAPIVIVDTDILSMFAKAEALVLLGQLFGRDRLATTPAIRDEIAVPLQYGYSFPLQVLAETAIALLTNRAWLEHERLRAPGAALGRGELEAIAFCKTEGAVFVTNDLVARRFALAQGVRVLSLQAILRGLWESSVCTKSEVHTVLERIKQADRLEISLEVESEIFDEG